MGNVKITITIAEHWYKRFRASLITHVAVGTQLAHGVLVVVGFGGLAVGEGLV